MLTSAVPIESKFQEMMVDNLNAEVVLGTVTNVKASVCVLCVCVFVCVRVCVL